MTRKRGWQTSGYLQPGARSGAPAPLLLALLLPLPLVVQAGPREQEPASEPQRSQAFEERQLAPGRYLGAASCASSNCHGNLDELRETGVLQNEYFTWLDDDPHANAYNALFDEESQRMAENLRLENPAHQDKACLACHTLYVETRLKARPIDLKEGVSCESCHGPASGWIAGHVEEGWTHRDSVAQGMIDLRQIARRGRLCLSCHLGNADKTVDHELIAAGHPDLIFELDNFTGALPPHWLHRPQRHGVRAWAVGQVTSFRQGLEQLARRARSERWPEFADMSCLACHHSLEDGAWRKERGYRWRAGLPPWSPARWAVLRHLVARFAPGEKEGLDTQVDELARAVAHMNQPQRTAELAEEIGAVLDSVLPQVAAAPWNGDQVRVLAGTIAGDAEYLRQTDVHSAEQAFLALNSLVSYLAEIEGDPALLRGELARLLTEIDRLLVHRYRFDWDPFAAYLEEIGQQL